MKKRTSRKSLRAFRYGDHTKYVQKRTAFCTRWTSMETIEYTNTRSFDWFVQLSKLTVTIEDDRRGIAKPSDSVSVMTHVSGQLVSFAARDKRNEMPW
jgi:hypothetical protein